MKRSTIVLIGVLTLLMLHGSQLLFGWIGFACVLGAIFALGLIARGLYWRQLRKLQKAARGLPYEDRRLVYSLAQIDDETRRDMEELVERERRAASEKSDIQ